MHYHFAFDTKCCQESSSSSSSDSDGGNGEEGEEEEDKEHDAELVEDQQRAKNIEAASFCTCAGVVFCLGFRAWGLLGFRYFAERLLVAPSLSNLKSYCTHVHVFNSWLQILLVRSSALPQALKQAAQILKNNSCSREARPCWFMINCFACACTCMCC